MDNGHPEHQEDFSKGGESHGCQNRGAIKLDIDEGLHP